jgi:hypothetical protein
MDQARRARRVSEALHAIPHLQQVPAVGLELRRALILSRGTDDPAAGGVEIFDDLAQPGPLVLVGNAARYPVMTYVWQVDEKAPGETDVGRQASTLGTNWIFDDLCENFLTLSEEVGNVGVRWVRLQFLAILAEKDVREVIEDTSRFADVEKGVAGEPDVNERRLHPGKDAIHAALVEVTNYR